MTRTKQRIVTSLSLFASMVICSFLVNDENKPVFIAFAVVFFCIACLSFLSGRLSQTWLARFLESVDNLRISYFGLFLTFYSLSLALINHSFVIQGLLVALADYAIFYAWVGKFLGKDVLRPICDKLNILQPSTQLPEEFKNPDWGL